MPESALIELRIPWWGFLVQGIWLSLSCGQMTNGTGRVAGFVSFDGAVRPVGVVTLVANDVLTSWIEVGC